MSGKAVGGKDAPQERRRNPSRPAKGSVGDITEAFKKQMAATHAEINSTPDKTNKKASANANTNKKAKDNKGKCNTLTEEVGEIETSPTGIKAHFDKHDNENNEDSLRNSSGMPEKCSSNNSEQDNDEATNINNSQDKATQKEDCNADILENLKQIQETLNKFDRAIFDPKNGLEAQVAKTIARVDNLYTDIHGAVDGLKVHMTKTEEMAGNNQAKITVVENNMVRMTKMLDESKQISQQLILMQGLIQKFSQQGIATNAKIQDLTKRGMEQNLVFYGINEVKGKEICKKGVQEFLADKMQIEIDVQEIWKAHRLGMKREGFVRPMVTKVAYHVKDKVMENLGKLKGLRNEVTDKPLFISEQIPEAVSETKKQITSQLKILNSENDARPLAAKKKITVQNDKILVDGNVHELDITTPQPSELFLNLEQQKKVDEINKHFVMTETSTVKNSSFVALAVQTNSIEEVKTAYVAAVQRFPSMDHVMMGYGLKEDGVLKMGACDDSEYGAGTVIRKTLAAVKARNTTVFVVRRYGGLHLGPDRFATIESITRQAVELLRQQF